MLFAFFGSLELSLALGVIAIAVALPIVVLMAMGKRHKAIPVVAIPAIAVAAFAGVRYYQETSIERFPPLTSDLVLLIDDSRSMGKADDYQDARTRERVAELESGIRDRLTEELPGKIKAIEAELAEKDKNADGADQVRHRLAYWHKQQAMLNANQWRPSRLQLVQALLTHDNANWLRRLVRRHEARIHIFHLDEAGRAVKLFDIDDPSEIELGAQAISRLEPFGNDSRLGDALHALVEQFRHAPFNSIVMFSDGITTRGESLSKAALFADQKGVRLMLVGMGTEQRRLQIHDLNVDDPIYIGDTSVMEARLTAHGFKEDAVPIILKLCGKDGKETELAREILKIAPAGKSIKFRLLHRPKEVGPHRYIIQVEPPKLNLNELPIHPSNLRLESTIEVIESKRIKVLFVESQPRYEFRFVKNLLERVDLDGKKSAIELKMLLLDADEEFAQQDRSALKNFPATLPELNEYDALILGDCDPNHVKLRNRLKDITAFVRGEDEQGKKSARLGGGLLFIAGATHNPHSYKDTPLADLLPVEPFGKKVPAEEVREEQMRPELTPAGRNHPIFRFSSDDAENRAIWPKLTPMYWSSTGYRVKPLGEVLAVHPTQKAAVKQFGLDTMYPLVVQQYVGSGRTLFYGFDETWRWRLRDESKFDRFWIQTVRYLTRGGSTRTDLRLDRRMPYVVGDTIKVTVRLPPYPPVPKLDPGQQVKIAVTHVPGDAKEKTPSTIILAKVEGSWGTYEGIVDGAREGKYRFQLTHPDMSATQPDRENPSAEAVVQGPPGELSNLALNADEMKRAAEITQGIFFTLGNVDQFLDMRPPAR